MQMNVSIKNISKHRSEIMGFAILGVMLAHIKTTCVFPDTIWSKLLGFLCYSIFTGGFIFLSGLGLYSSVSANDSIKQFYIKRIKRLLIPYWIISTPYFLFTDIYQSQDFIAFLEHFSTLYFWIHGNYSGMWYISMAVVLYLIYPMIHKVVYSKGTNILLRYCIFILMVSVMIFCLKTICSQYYDIISVGIDKLYLFGLGSFSMWAINNLNQQKENNTVTILLVVVGGGITLILSILVTRELWAVINLTSIFVIANIFENIRVVFLRDVFQWLGKHSLELYILHLLTFNFLNRIDNYFSVGVHIVVGVVIALLICQPIHYAINIVIGHIYLKAKL